ncbi:MAG: hypothetical protein ABI162_01690 [Luteolibacter sp.]
MQNNSHFDSQCWIVSSARQRMEGYYDYFILYVVPNERLISLRTRSDMTGNFAYDEGPGKRWTCQEYLDLLETPGEKVWYLASGKAKLIFDLFQLSWFLPIIQRLGAGELVPYDEVNDLHQKRFGKPLRLLPLSASNEYREKFERELDYDY